MKKVLIALALLASTAPALAGAANWRVYRCVYQDGKPVTLSFAMGTQPGRVSGSSQDFDTFNADEGETDVMAWPDRDHPQRVITIHGIASLDQTVGGPRKAMSCGRPTYIK